MESRNLLPQNTRTSLPIIKHSACKLVHEVNVLQDFDNSRHMKLFKHLLFFLLPFSVIINCTSKIERS